MAVDPLFESLLDIVTIGELLRFGNDNFMGKFDMRSSVQPQGLGQEMYDLIRRLYPICRSITGEGVRLTLKLIQEIIPLEIHEVESGTKAFDWTVPKEWNIKDGYVKDSGGNRVIDFQKSNLHVVNYSSPVHAKCVSQN